MEPEQALELDWGHQFKKDMKRLKKQGKDLNKLWAIVELLQTHQPLPERCVDHALTGKPWRDCHIEGNWVLLYRVEEKENVLRLFRSGSHSELEL